MAAGRAQRSGRHLAPAALAPAPRSQGCGVGSAVRLPHATTAPIPWESRSPGGVEIERGVGRAASGPGLLATAPPGASAHLGQIARFPNSARGATSALFAIKSAFWHYRLLGRLDVRLMYVAYFLGPVPTGRIALRPPPQPPHKAAQPASESWGLLLLLWAAAARAAAATCDEHAAVHGHQQLSALPAAPANSYSASGAKQTAEGMQRAEMCCKRKDMCGARRALQRCCH